MDEKEKASASTLAERNIEQSKSYRKLDSQSSFKIEIGENLLYLLTDQKDRDDWQQFDRLLRLYVSLRHL